MIELIEVNQQSASNIIEDVKSGKIHVVCVAWNGLTHLKVYGEFYCKLPEDTVNSCVEIVNKKRETGTLFPQAYLTIVPVSIAQKIGDKEYCFLSNSEMKNAIYDVFKANEEYLKSEIIYFTLEKSYFDTHQALKIVKEYILENESKNLFVKTVWFEK